MYKKLNKESYYRKFYFLDTFHAQCMDVDPLSMEQFDRAAAAAQVAVKNPAFACAKHIIGTGCGDSNLVAFAVKEAFAHYLPDVTYEAVEAIELSRHYEFGADETDSLALFISVSGGIYRTIEALEQCRRHGITTVAVTDTPTSRTAEEADVLYYVNAPAGDNNAGLRTYYINMISCIVLAATMAQQRTGHPYVEELRAALQEYHDRFFAQLEKMDDLCFAAAIHWMDKRYLEIVGDGPMFWAAKFIQAKVVELSGDACSVIDSENYMHVNRFMGPAEEFADLVLINGNDSNNDRIAETVGDMVQAGRGVMIFSDKTPEELGIEGDVLYCPMAAPEAEWNFLAPLYAYLPGSIFAGFRHTTIGEPMFRGGMDPTIFVPTYFSPIDVIER